MTEWFEDMAELDDPEGVVQLSAEQERFIRRLRFRAESGSWPLDPDDSWLDRVNETHHVIAFVNLSDSVEPSNVAEFCALFDGSSVRCDRSTMGVGMWIPESLSSLGMSAEGSPEEMADAAAEWFEEILRRPVVKARWRRFGKTVLTYCCFGDTLEGFTEQPGDLPLSGLAGTWLRRFTPPDFIRYIRNGPAGDDGSWHAFEKARPWGRAEQG